MNVLGIARFHAGWWTNYNVHESRKQIKIDVSKIAYGDICSFIERPMRKAEIKWCVNRDLKGLL